MKPQTVLVANRQRYCKSKTVTLFLIHKNRSGGGGAFVGRVVNGVISWQTFNPIIAEPTTCPVTPNTDKRGVRNLIDRLAKASR